MSEGTSSGAPPCRLHLMRAEGAPVAAVIRRGPTRWFHVALWSFADRTVEHGAWTRIKLYPDRCAISPDGSRLAVFALGGEWGPYFAVSRAPWLQALAAWGTVGTWTTGAHFTREAALVLAGCTASTPLHGVYPQPVVCEPVDTWWIRGGLFRELRTGWSLVPLDPGGAPVEAADAWVGRVPAPLGQSPRCVVATRPHATEPRRALVVVSLAAGEREYYLREEDEIVPLPDVQRAEWGQGEELLVAARSGHLRILDRGLACRWEYDMNLVTPEPRAAPDWATRPF